MKVPRSPVATSRTIAAMYFLLISALHPFSASLLPSRADFLPTLDIISIHEVAFHFVARSKTLEVAAVA
jgi:hypothetical protein